MNCSEEAHAPSDRVALLADRVEALTIDNARLERAVAARDAFLAIAAHELRNPMTPILGRVTLLKRSVMRDDLSMQDVVDGLDRIEKLVVHFIHRATTLLDVSRAESDRVVVDSRPVDLARLVVEVVDRHRPLSMHAGVALTVDVDDDAPLTTLVDPVAVEQVLENLLSNAIKYGGGTPIRIAASADATDRVARITVRDDGPGIAAEHQARIFERYERAVEPGSTVTGYGVGLWIVRSLCEAMGGAIAVVSQPGAGCTFTVCLPLFQDSA